LIANPEWACAAPILHREDRFLCAEHGGWPSAVARLAANPAEAATMEEAGRGKVLDRYIWERAGRRVQELLEDTNGRSR
jgi:hypothetical protein